jgi:hypothetical protein
MQWRHVRPKKHHACHARRDFQPLDGAAQRPPTTHGHLSTFQKKFIPASGHAGPSRYITVRWSITPLGRTAMKHSLAAIFVAFALAVPASAQDGSGQLVGTWKFVSQSLTEVQSGKVTKPFGDKVGGYINYTKGGRLQFVLVGEGRQKSKLPLKDEDRIKLFDTLAAGSGTYKVEGNALTIHYDTSWHELWTDVTHKRTFEIVGNKLTITAAPGKSPQGIEAFFTIVLERVE